MNKFDLLQSLEGGSLRPGTYPAIASGNESKVVQGTKTYTFKFETYVKGFNVPDVITVNSDGQVRSKVLGEQEIKQGGVVFPGSTALQPGTYPAQATGYTSRVVHNGASYVFKFESGVRGINCRDTVTVNMDGTITSELLGQEISVAK